MAWTKTKQNNEYDFALSTVQAMADTAAINSDVINLAISGRYVILGIDVTVGGTDVVADLILQGSFDNSNWTTVTTVVADTTPNVTGQKTAIVDLTAKPYPWFRLRFNNAGVDVDAVGRFKFIVVSPTTYYERAI